METPVRQVNRSLVRPVTIAAALIGTIQALAWIGLALVSIFYYHSVIVIDDTLPTDSFRRVIHWVFLDADFTNDDVIVTTQTFNVFMYVYVVISFVWLITSLNLLWAMTRNKWSNSYNLVELWSVVTLAISVLDIILLALLAADFVAVKDTFNPVVPPSPPSPEPTFTTPETTIATVTVPPGTTELTTLPDITTTPWSTTDEGTTESSTLPDISTTTWSTTDGITETSDTTPLLDTTSSTEPSSSDSTTEESTTVSLDPDPGPQVQILAGNASKTIQRLLAGDVMASEVSTGFEDIKNLVYTAYGTVISLAARGYILWIVNVVFAVILIKFAYGLRKEAAPSLFPRINAYSTSGRPWNNLYDQTDIGNGYANSGFTDDNDRTMFPRSDSFTTDPEIKNRNPLSNGANPYAPSPERNPQIPVYPPNPNVVNGRVAKIGKSGGRRTPPQNIPPPNVPIHPYIPDPDYSPPVSPMPKSVLRPRSNYVL